MQSIAKAQRVSHARRSMARLNTDSVTCKMLSLSKVLTQLSRADKAQNHTTGMVCAFEEKSFAFIVLRQNYVGQSLVATLCVA